MLAVLLAVSPACPDSRVKPVSAESPRSRTTATSKIRWNAPVALDALPAGLREKVARVVQSPTLTTHAPAEEFPANFYDWLLDHPDRVALAWRRLGVPCVSITNHGNGAFGWNDGEGSDLTWQCAWKGSSGRIWYADGQARPGPHLPLVSVRAVAVLRCSQRRESDGRTFVTHDVDIYLQTDSKAAALVMRLIGPATPRLAQQGASQLLLFFSGIARHLEAHPEKTFSLLKS
jgi:hypothetical protein